MEQSWIVTAGRLSQYLFYALVAASLAGIAFRRAFGRPQAGPTGDNRWIRFFVEYFGNTDLEVERVGAWERRRNLQARVLMDHIKNDLAGRDVPRWEKERLLEQLRESVRAEKRTG